MSKAEKTRQFIIEKAAELFNQQGYSGTSMSDIMKATSLTKGGLYGNFKSKEEISIAAFQHAVTLVTNTIRNRTKYIDNSLDKLKTVVYFYKERIFDPPVAGGCPIQNTSIEVDDSNPVLKEKVTEAFEFWHRSINRTLEKGIEAGEIKADIDTKEFASFFIGSIEGGILMSKLCNDNAHFNTMAKYLVVQIEELKK